MKWLLAGHQNSNVHSLYVENTIQYVLTPFESIQPYPPSNEQIPRQYVGPLFGDKVGIVGDHMHKGGLGIFGRIKDVVEFEEGCGGVGLGDGCGHNEEVQQGKEQHHVLMMKKRGNAPMIISQKYIALQAQYQSQPIQIMNKKQIQHTQRTELAHDLFGNVCLRQENEEQPKGLRSKGGVGKGRMDGFRRYSDNVQDSIQIGRRTGTGCSSSTASGTSFQRIVAVTVAVTRATWMSELCRCCPRKFGSIFSIHHRH